MSQFEMNMAVKTIGWMHHEAYSNYLTQRGSAQPRYTRGPSAAPLCSWLCSHRGAIQKLSRRGALWLRSHFRIFNARVVCCPSRSRIPSTKTSDRVNPGWPKMIGWKCLRAENAGTCTCTRHEMSIRIFRPKMLVRNRQFGCMLWKEYAAEYTAKFHHRFA